MTQVMSDWSELPHDLLGLIGSRLNLIEDYLNFGTVRKSWHSAATKHNFNSELPRVPWLMLAEEEDGNNGKASLLHPFSGVQIDLPHQDTTEDYEGHQTGDWPMFFFQRAVLSASPSHTTFSWSLRDTRGSSVSGD
ncbi:hypothetical protein RND71_017717 [Anisodus tanguticus]|uniref:F-box protein n=1 Tax=Anisodus tanguticus TaxID=243964 RepID=A0AAE1S2U4_9SOLA|nr:hypothetical protein RND71_017717 [Anisodus tanguticus]